MTPQLAVKDWGLVDYATTFDAMQRFTADRLEDTPDALWLCEHLPVFTQGLAGIAGHVLDAGDIPILGQSTDQTSRTWRRLYVPQVGQAVCCNFGC